jgi:hypothetical protein
MFLQIVKYFFLILIGLIVLIVLVASPFIIKARNEGERLFEKYESYTENVLADNFQLKQYPVKAEFQKLHPWKFLKMFKIIVNSRQGDRTARVNSLDATMFVFMKMFTLLIRPDYNYNLPMLSVDFIFIGGKRVFIIELIDPAQIEDANKKIYYAKMRKWMPEVAKFEQSDISEWWKAYLTDFSIHIKSDRTKDDLLFDIYKAYLEAYVDMTKNAEKLSPDMSAKVKGGIEQYVSTLLAKGGPAVNVFEQMLGPEGQQEYVRTVMFGVD